MKTSESSILTGLDRMNGLLAWWGMPNVIDAGEIEARTKRFQVLVVDLSKLLSEASSSQAQALSAANEQFTRSLRELLGARQPPEFMAAQSDLVTGFMESLAAQTKAWAELTQKLHACCSAMTHEAAPETGRRPPGAVPAKSQSEAERLAAKEATKRVAHG